MISIRARFATALLLSAVAAFASAGAAAQDVTLHVAPAGRDDAAGTAESPFQTLERARDEVRTLKQRGAIDAAGVTVLVHPGDYPLRGTLRLTAVDSGADGAPVVYRAAGPAPPRFTGGTRLTSPTAVSDSNALARIPESARGHVVEFDLAAAGVSTIIPFELGAFASGRGAQTHPAMELFVDREPMTWARWPNAGFVETGDITGPQSLKGWDNKPGSPEGRFRFEDDRIARWAEETDAWLYGYWYWNWADSYEKIERIDPAAHEIVLAQPWHRYGYKKGMRFFAVNMLCELDAPGEWYLDRARGKVYLYPKEDLANAAIEISTTAFPFVEIDGASHVRFEGLTWDCGAADGIIVRGGENVQIVGCTIARMAGAGIEVRGGRGHTVRSCDIHTMGRGGIVMAGGDRKTLVRGDHLVENCRVHHLSRIDHTYTPGVWLDGVGNRIRHNLFHDIASSAMRIEGNDHLIELNEAHHVVTESDDQGAVDMFGNATYRGNVYRYNYWHHLGSAEQHGDSDKPQRAGIRLDDAICGVEIRGNIFQRCCDAPTHFGGVQIHGGKENLVEGNLFVDCGAAVSFSAWGEARWLKFVANALDAPAIDKALYLERYPALAHLSEGNDTNTIRANLMLRCGQTFLRAPAGVVASGNRELPEGKEFPEGPDGRIVWSHDDAQRLGLGDIPFDTIGLYPDEWRSRDGSDWGLHPAK
ncbi:MAG: right-handed parallel beta-helix repeat-containing protein [Candidatus Hydrogenedentes bacterium]|nr:right-handed parallel beta-helix repeat-containing protein [Candidatus Hydrogenedentota bacterium]